MKSFTTFRSTPSLVTTFPSAPISTPPIQHDKKSVQICNCFECEGKGHFSSHCPSRQMDIVFSNDDYDYHKQPVNKEIEVETRDAEQEQVEETMEGYAKWSVLLIQLTLKEAKSDCRCQDIFGRLFCFGVIAF